MKGTMLFVVFTSLLTLATSAQVESTFSIRQKQQADNNLVKDLVGIWDCYDFNTNEPHSAIVNFKSNGEYLEMGYDSINDTLLVKFFGRWEVAGDTFTIYYFGRLRAGIMDTFSDSGTDRGRFKKLDSNIWVQSLGGTLPTWGDTLPTVILKPRAK